MPWLNICACIDWICVNILTEYVCIPWLNMWTWLNWICLHDLTEYQCMTSLSLFGCVHDLIETVCMSAWLNWICVHGFTESVYMTQFNLCMTQFNLCTCLDWICVHIDLTEYVYMTWLNLCVWLDWICVNGLGEQTSMSLPEQALPKYNEQRKRRTSGMWSWWTCGSQFVPRLLCHSSAPVLRSSMPYCKPSPVNYFTYSQYNYVNYCISYYTSSVTFYKYIRHQYRAMQTTEHTIA